MHQGSFKKVCLWLLTIALFAAHLYFRSQVHADEIEWQEIFVRSGECRIAFPSLPQMIEQKLKLDHEGAYLTYDVYLAPYRDQSVCLLLVAQYPNEVPAGSEVAGLEGLLRGILHQHPENRVVFADMGKHQGYPAMNFMVQSGKNFFRGRAIMIGNQLYLIAMEGAKQHFQEAMFQKFLKTFRIAKQEMSAPVEEH